MSQVLRRTDFTIRIRDFSVRNLSPESKGQLQLILLSMHTVSLTKV